MGYACLVGEKVMLELSFEPHTEETNKLVFEQVQQRWLETGNFGLKKKRECTMASV